MNKFLIALFLITANCQTGKLKIIADLPTSLKETSAIEKTKNSNVLWVIEDAGNKNHLYGVNIKGKIIKNIEITNAKNTDWEDLTSDDDGNIYIGDFGNNSKKRKNFSIYKILNPKSIDKSTQAEIINFSLPETMKTEDFESFFLFKDNFYMFSKDHKKCKLFSVPNTVGDHIAKFISEIELNGKNTKVTSADISNDGKIVLLLNHNKLFKLTEFTSDDFLSGNIETVEFDHNSQKEGIYFKDNNTLYITDEKTKVEGGNLYEFSLN